MKRYLRSFSILLFGLSAFISQQAQAQLVSAEAFLQGDYVEVGIATNGAFGTDNSAPTGYHPRGVGTLLGFVADIGKDGWTVGSPDYIGDYFLPGSPQEGWDMQVGTTWAQAWRGSGGTSFTGGLTGSCTDYSSVGGVTKGIWEGTLGTLSVKAVTTVKKDKLYFTTNVTIINTGTTTVKDIYYDRTVDPDQEVPTPGTTSDFTTDNKIVFAIPNVDNKTLVTGIGVSSVKAYLGLASRDCRAVPYITTSGLTPTDSLSKIHSGVGTVSIVRKLDSNIRQDCGIGIVFKIDSLQAGDSTKLSYAYVLSTADVDSAFEDLKPELAVEGKPYASGDTIVACNGEILDLEVLDGDYYGWKWSPATGLSDTLGSSIKVTVGTSVVTYTATATNLACPIEPITITIVPIINPNLPKVVSPLYYCQYDPAPLLKATPATGSVLRWYYTKMGGTPLDSMRPFTNIVGSRYYYVSQVAGSLCESDRDSILVITRALPKIDSVVFTNPTNCAAKDGTITFRTDSANTVYNLEYDKNGTLNTLTFTSGNDRKFTLTGLGGGSYSTFILVNKYGCKSIPFYGPIVLKDPVPPGPPLSNNGPKCVGEEATLSAPFIAGASYSWTGPAGFISNDRLATFTVKANSAGVYQLIVTVGTCVYTPSTTTFEVSLTPKNQKFKSPYTICQNSNLKVDILRENTNINYFWDGNGIGQFNQALIIPNIQLAQSGSYVLTATSDNGCIAKDTIVVIVDQKVSFAISADTAICSVDSAQLRVNTNSVNVTWAPSTGLSDSTSSNVKARPSATTIYTAIAKSGSTCPDTSGTVKVRVIATPTVKGYDTTVRMNIPYTLMPTYGQEVIKWVWTPSDSLSCSNCPNPVFNSNVSMVYKIEGINKEGCVGSDLVKINVFCDGANVTMPNAFTPNGDGNNDIFYVRGTGFSVKRFSIYNRLGQLVFSKENFMPNDPRHGWDGTLNGQDISDAAGFVYMMEVICFNSKNAPELVKGTVLMIK
jgi:gliding motility-associated-like protein